MTMIIINHNPCRCCGKRITLDTTGNSNSAVSAHVFFGIVWFFGWIRPCWWIASLYYLVLENLWEQTKRDVVPWKYLSKNKNKTNRWSSRPNEYKYSQELEITPFLSDRGEGRKVGGRLAQWSGIQSLFDGTALNIIANYLCYASRRKSRFGGECEIKSFARMRTITR